MPDQPSLTTFSTPQLRLLQHMVITWDNEAGSSPRPTEYFEIHIALEEELHRRGEEIY
jgi:hypothetical protein